MSRSNMNCQAVSIPLKIMFYRDTYALAIYTSRGACARGDIVIRISYALARNISQRGEKKPLDFLHIFDIFCWAIWFGKN